MDRRRRRPAASPSCRSTYARTESVAAFVETALAHGGHIDALVNNAAYGLSGSLEETTIDEAQNVLDTNLFGAVRTVRAVLPHFGSSVAAAS